MVINNLVDPKKTNPPVDRARHREVLRKAHGLVIFINGHREILAEFLALVVAKRSQVEGARIFDSLIEDVVARWDSELPMLERLVYFDAEILKLFRMEGLGLPADLVLDRFEFDLASAMTEVLVPFRIFTKFVQLKSSVTLAYVPRKIDDLVSALAPGSFAAVLQGNAAGVLAQMKIFQT